MQRILIRMPNWLGDGVMASPIFEVLKSQYPKADFVFVGPKVVCDLYRQDSRVKEFFIDTTKQESRGGKSRLWATYKLAKKIGQCDLAITFANHIFSALLLYFSGSIRRVGFGGFVRNLLLTDTLKAGKKEHQVLTYARLLEPLGFGFSLGGLKLPIVSTQRESGISVGISTGAAFGASKIWPKEYFVQVVAHLLQEGYRVLLFGSGEEAKNNHAITQEVAQMLPPKNLGLLEDWSNKTSIEDLVSKIGAVDVFLGHDSGPTHIAAAMQTPIVALFGATHPTFGLPWKHDKNIVINKHLPCAPCQKKTCPLKHHECMRQITPQEVITALTKLLKDKYES